MEEVYQSNVHSNSLLKKRFKSNWCSIRVKVFQFFQCSEIDIYDVFIPKPTACDNKKVLHMPIQKSKVQLTRKANQNCSYQESKSLSNVLSKQFPIYSFIDNSRQNTKQ